MIKPIINSLNYIILIYPLILNIFIIFLSSSPSKTYKYHPLTFLAILLLYTIITANKINIIFKSLIPFILFLIIIGGLIVIFIYITRIANNELFSLNFKYLLTIFIKFFILTTILIYFTYLNKNFLINYNWINELINIWKFYSNNFENKIFFNNLYKIIDSNSLIFIIHYLYLALICIINICYKFKVPLRQITFYE